MLIAQWILEITDILMNKIVSFWKKSMIKKNFARRSRAKFFLPPQSQNRSYGLARCWLNHLVFQWQSRLDSLCKALCRARDKSRSRVVIESLFSKYYGVFSVIVWCLISLSQNSDLFTLTTPPSDNFKENSKFML